MTKDQATEIQTRLNTATVALQEAWRIVPAEETDGVEMLRDSLEEALQSANTALNLIRQVTRA